MRKVKLQTTEDITKIQVIKNWIFGNADDCQIVARGFMRHRNSFANILVDRVPARIVVRDGFRQDKTCSTGIGRSKRRRSIFVITKDHRILYRDLVYDKDFENGLSSKLMKLTIDENYHN